MRSDQRAGFLEAQPGEARKELGVIAIPEIAEEVRLHMPLWKELLLAIAARTRRAEKLVVQFRVVES